jgi:hypothetical protein
LPIVAIFPGLRDLPFGPMAFYTLENPHRLPMTGPSRHGYGAGRDNETEWEYGSSNQGEPGASEPEESRSFSRMSPPPRARRRISASLEEVVLGEEEDYPEERGDRKGSGQSSPDSPELGPDNVYERDPGDEWDPPGPCRGPEDCSRRHVHCGVGGNRLVRMGSEHEIHGNSLAWIESQWQQAKVLAVCHQRRRAGLDKPLAVCGSLFAGHGQSLWGPSHRQRCDLTIFREPGRIDLYNLHGSHYHYKNHEPSCRQGSGDPHEEFSFDPETTANDLFKREYARAMSEANGGALTFKYIVETECQVFHRATVTSPKSGLEYGSVLAMLRAEFARECVLPPTFRRKEQRQLVSQILKGDEDVQGFVTIVGGSENHFDKVGRQFSFCLQRAPPRSCEIGDFTRRQVSDYCAGDPKLIAQQLKKMERTPLTLTKHYYEGHGETISTELLRWLIVNRGFWGFKVLHLLRYNTRDYFRPFLEKCLQVSLPLHRRARPILLRDSFPFHR